MYFDSIIFYKTYFASAVATAGILDSALAREALGPIMIGGAARCKFFNTEPLVNVRMRILMLKPPFFYQIFVFFTVCVALNNKKK